METVPQNAQTRIRRWVERVLDHKGWSAHKLAQQAHVSPSTVHRLLNDDRFVTSTRTIEKIVNASGIAAPDGILTPTRPDGGFHEPEAVYEGALPPQRPLKPSEHAALWRLQSLALQTFGCLPGDLLVVDPEVPAEAGDIVCVQSVDPRSGEAETVFRVFDPPYAITHTAAPDARRKPLVIDGETNRIWGTVIRVERNTRA